MDEQTVNDQSTQSSDQNTDSQAQLLELKTQALSVLLPLVDKIEEPPERKFEILMTAARSSDDPVLLGKTLAVAKQINGDSKKAEAVLDVLNEINYHLSN